MTKFFFKIVSPTLNKVLIQTLEEVSNATKKLLLQNYQKKPEKPKNVKLHQLNVKYLRKYQHVGPLIRITTKTCVFSAREKKERRIKWHTSQLDQRCLMWLRN